MKSVLFYSVLLLMGASAHAQGRSNLAAAIPPSQNGCSRGWAVEASRADNVIRLVIREENQEGPACDLVVSGMNYVERHNILSVYARPARTCPLDTIGKRSALVSWQLPFDRRGEGILRLWVNGREAGRLRLNTNEVNFEGSCL